MAFFQSRTGVERSAQNTGWQRYHIANRPLRNDRPPLHFVSTEPSPNRTPKQRGYTLVELLITTGIVALALSAASYSGLNELIERHRRQVSLQEVMRLVQFARSEAVNRQQSITLCALDDASTCTASWTGNTVAVFRDADYNRRVDPGEALRAVHWPASRGSLQWRASLGRKHLEFSAMGSTAQNGSFLLCHRDGDKAADLVITLNRGGRPYVNGDTRRRCR